MVNTVKKVYDQNLRDQNFSLQPRVEDYFNKRSEWLLLTAAHDGKRPSVEVATFRGSGGLITSPLGRFRYKISPFLDQTEALWSPWRLSDKQTAVKWVIRCSAWFYFWLWGTIQVQNIQNYYRVSLSSSSWCWELAPTRKEAPITFY